MMRRALAILLLVIGACDDKGSSQDAGPPVDARFLVDAGVHVCAEDKGCTGLAFQTRCDLARSRCVECLSSEDCTQEPSFGPTCQPASQTCECESDQDCAGNSYGSFCHPTVRACGCITEDECDAASACKLEPYLGTGIRTCRTSL